MACSFTEEHKIKMPISPNVLFHSDCITLFERTSSEVASLVYLDPPWYSDEGFEGGFWHENNDSKVKKSKQGWKLEKEAHFQDYLSFLSKVLQQTYRVLKSNGILFFHVEPRLSGYVKLLLDEVFGRSNFVTEIILPHLRFPNRLRPTPEHSTLLLYGKTEDFAYRPPKRLLTQDEIQGKFSQRDEKGAFRFSDLTTSIERPNLVYDLDGILPPTGRSWRYSKEKMEELKSQGLIHFTPNRKPQLKIYVSENAEVEIGNIWDDISLRISPSERTNFSAQQSLALLTRIIQMGTNEGDTVFDPFCGSGTTLVAAEKLKRKWIGCDILQEACLITIQRLGEEGKALDTKDYTFISQLDLEKRYSIIHQVYSTLSKQTQITATSQRNLQVFLCHSSSDKPMVEKFYSLFINDRVDAWLDKKNLIPGQDWKLEIQRAVKNSDVVVVFLSSSSITKEGFVQKEIRIALDTADEKPDGTIFIIPARLEDCEVPDRLAKFQWVDLFEKDGYERLFKALQIRADSLNIVIGNKKYTPTK